MVTISPAVDLTGLQVFYTTDHLLSNGPVLVFYGPCQPTNSNISSSSRIQTHVFTAAGIQSYQKLVVSPVSPLYSAVTCLPREDQGDEVSRALAFSLLKYFTELPEAIKDAWIQQSLSATRPSAALGLFHESHAADLAHRMVPVENAAEVVRQVQTAFAAQVVSHVDLDLVLPKSSIAATSQHDHQNSGTWDDPDIDIRYGDYTPLISQFGEATFLPTSKIRRAPSRPAALNRSPTFTRAQKENLRLEMSQLVETEQRYVQKLDELVNHIAANFRHNAPEQMSNTSSPDVDTLKKLFPPSLDDIYHYNSAFLSAIQTLFEETNSAAVKDIEITTDATFATSLQTHGKLSDSIGAVNFAKILVEWFPKFAKGYSDYIKAHSDFGPFLRSFTANGQSPFSQRVQATGEQRLMSLLIEPVQRLPRYSLYIDNIVKQLPHKHPALRFLLKAKDIISDICNQDEESGPLSKISRIKEIIPSWPAAVRPRGRFILAVDALELQPPFDYDNPASQPAEFLLLLFAGHLVRVKKLGASPMTAQSFMSEVENNNLSTHPTLAKQGSSDAGLLFSESTSIDEITVIETGSDKVVRIIPNKPREDVAIRSPNDAMVRTFLLKGTYEGRVSRWTRELGKARVEGRFTESERENVKWEAHSLDIDRHGLGFFAAVYENGVISPESSQRANGSIRILIDPGSDSEKKQARQEGVEVVISVSSKGQGFYWLDIECENERSTRDLTTESDFLPILVKRLGLLLTMRQQIRNPVLTVYLLQHNSSILASVKHAIESRNGNHAENQPKQPQSPVKFLSGLFGGKSVKENVTPRDDKPTTPLNRLPRFDPPGQDRSALSPTQAKSRDAQNSAVTLIDEKSANASASDPLSSLEQTLSCYLLALRARKGNIIGSVVNRRAMADETEVNELYNSLQDNPGNLERAAQAPVDVLFAAFENFITIAWNEKLGPVIASSVLSDLQTQMEVMNPLDYDEYAEGKLSALAPQNRRALAQIIGLLADLLSAMRNDGDRGTLTAAFTEIVVSDGESLAFIPMFDRLVENHEMLAPERPKSQEVSSAFGSVSSHTTRSTKPGSVSSKASSLSRRLGLGSLRKENVKAESPSKGSLRRMGSRKALPPDPPVDRPTPERPKSTDLGSHFDALRRPGSRDAGSRPGTAHSQEGALLNNSSVETSPARTASVLKKKRRSSLSDLTTLQTPSTSPFWTGSASKQIHGIFQSPAPTPSPIKLPPIETPSKSSSIRELPNTKENAPPSTRLALAPPALSLSPKRPEVLQPLAPAAPPKGVLSERISSGNTPPPLNVSRENQDGISRSSSKTIETGSPKKLRVQSPVKLRERLDTHQKAVESADTTLRAELARIGEELAATSSKTTAGPSPASPSKQDNPMLTNLNTRLKALETKVAHLTRNLNDHSTSLQRDVSSSLQVSEQRVKAFDGELQQAKAENDALYARMNIETMKIFEQVREGHAVEELRRQLKESFAETDKWRKEATRLKRENIGLRSQLAE